MKRMFALALAAALCLTACGKSHEEEASGPADPENVSTEAADTAPETPVPDTETPDAATDAAVPDTEAPDAATDAADTGTETPDAVPDAPQTPDAAQSPDTSAPPPPAAETPTVRPNTAGSGGGTVSQPAPQPGTASQQPVSGETHTAPPPAPETGSPEPAAPAKVDAALLHDLFLTCTGYGASAGSSLRSALAAGTFLKFAEEYRITASEELDAMVQTAYASLDDEEREDFDLNFDGGVSYLVDQALEDYSAVKGDFENVGMGSAMEELVQAPGAAERWTALRGSVFAAIEAGV